MAVYTPPRCAPTDSVQDIDLELIQQTQAYLECLSRQQQPDLNLRLAWERFYDLYHPLLRRFALASHLARADVHDCVQDVWKEIVRSLPTFAYDPRRGRFRTWLYSLVRCKAIDLLRRRNKHAAESLNGQEGTGLHEPAPDPSADSERQDEREVVRVVLARLRDEVSECSYQVLHLRWIEGLSVPEVAAALDLTPRQVWFRHHRMKQKFRALFNQYARERTGRATRHAGGKQATPEAAAGTWHTSYLV